MEFDFWSKGENVRDARKANLDMFRKVAIPFGEKATFLKPDGEVVTGIRAVNAYGHSPGMLAFHVESGGQRLLIWGDVANQYVVSIQQPEWGTRLRRRQGRGRSIPRERALCPQGAGWERTVMDAWRLPLACMPA